MVFMLYYSPKFVFRVLATVTVVLCVLHTISRAVFYLVSDIDPTIVTFMWLFDMDTELSIPTWVNQMILAAAGLIAIAIALHSRAHRTLEKTWKYWLSIGLLFVYISLDEGASIHEAFGPVVQIVTGDLSGTVFNFSWVVGGILAVLVLASIYIRFLLRLPSRTSKLLLISAVLFLMGALGVEIIAGYYVSNIGWNILYSGLVLLEEALENIGVAVFIYTLLDYAATNNMRLSVRPST